MYDSKHLNGHNYYKDTEKRLYAYPLLKKHCEALEDDIAAIESGDMRCRSKCIVLLHARNERDQDEMMAALLEDKQIKLQKNRAEIKEIEDALAFLEDDSFLKSIELKYFRGVSDDEAAKLLHCDKSTIGRNRKAIIRKLSIIFYGVDATSRVR